MVNSLEYVVKIDAYEGPLDMLLDLIKRSQFDIHNLPISQLTAQYIQTIDDMKQKQIDVTANFMLMAATLLEIKSKVCLPKQNEVDPREELVNQLLDYQDYKNSVDKMREWKEFKEKFIKRQRTERIKKQKEGSIQDLIATYEKILQRQSELEEQNRMNELLNELKSHKYTIDEQMEFVRNCVENGRVRLDEFLLSLSCKDEMIVTFMAILELIRSDIQIILEDEHIFLERKDEKEEREIDEHTES